MKNITKVTKEIVQFNKIDNNLYEKLTHHITKNMFYKIQQIRVKNGNKIISSLVENLNLKEGQVYEAKKNALHRPYHNIKYFAVSDIHMNTIIEFSMYDENFNCVHQYERFYSHDLKTLINLFKFSKLELLNDYSFDIDTKQIIAPVKELSKEDILWHSVVDKFEKIYYSQYPNSQSNYIEKEITSTQVRNIESLILFNMVSNIKAQPSWSEAYYNYFKPSLTNEEFNIIKVTSKRERYIDAEEYDADKICRTLIISRI